MERKSKILLIDKAADRKTRIAILKDNGFAVYPAKSMEEARSRCKPGAYDLIIVHAGEEPSATLEFCQAIQERLPKQRVLISSGENLERPNAVGDEPQQLLQKVKSLLRAAAVTSDYASAA